MVELYSNLESMMKTFNVYTHLDCYPLQVRCATKFEAIAIGLAFQNGTTNDSRITSLPYFLSATRQLTDVVTAAICSPKAIRKY